MRARPQGKCESNKKLNSIDESSADKDSQKQIEVIKTKVKFNS
jgi:hypothetical protein